MQHNYHLDADVIERLNDNGYSVFHDGGGYIVRHRRDVDDISHVDDLVDLSDFADLVEWAARRQPQATQSEEEE